MKNFTDFITPPLLCFPCLSFIIIRWNNNYYVDGALQFTNIFVLTFHSKYFLLICFSLRSRVWSSDQVFPENPLRDKLFSRIGSKWGPGFAGQRQRDAKVTLRTEIILRVILFWEGDHTQNSVFEVRRKESEPMNEEAVGLSWLFQLFFPLEHGANYEPCGFHVLRILAKIDPCVETFPKFYTHILNPCVTASNTFFSKCQNCILHFNSFNIDSTYVQTKEYI